MRSFRWTRHLVSLAISTFCLTVVIRQVDFGAAVAATSQFRLPWLAVGLLSLALGYSMRIFRWSVMLRSGGADVSARLCAAPFLGSIGLNNVLPFRFGDVVRALVFPRAIGVERVTATGSLVLERLVDLLTLLICLSLGLAFSPNLNLPVWLASTAITLAIVGVSLLAAGVLLSGPLSSLIEIFSMRPVVLRQRQIVRNILRVVVQILVSFRAMSRPKTIVALFAISAGVWLGEIGLFGAVMIGFGLETSLGSAATVMAIATLATLVPSSPGYVGTFHAAAFAAVAMLGAPPEVAASFALVSHLALWVPTTVAGAVAILAHPGLFADVRSASTIKET